VPAGQTKNDKRAAAREQARLVREKQLQRERLRRWLIPTGVTVVVVAVIAVVVLVVSTSAPAPQSAAGPKNMLSDGILFTGSNGTAVATTTPAIPASGSPTPLPSDAGGDVPHVVEYIDFACPFCNEFESTNASKIQSLVAERKATLEIHPVAILDKSFQGTRYASRAINAGACVANFSPNDFLAVMNAFYAQQPKENSPGLTNAQILSLVHGAGVKSAEIDRCISGESFTAWVASTTSRFLANPDVVTPAGVGTPTIFVDGKIYSGSLTDPSAFNSFLGAATKG
jgi:protein-disulfide isomerase